MSIEFTINGKPYSVRIDDFPADINLDTFIRERAQLFGTKFYCREGGCGCCTVTVRSRHPATNIYYTRGVTSCLTLLNSCHGWDIVTIEGLGNRKDGYHPLQERLAHFNGTQCGYCSPGMVMNMHSLLEASNGRMSADEIENSFGGSLCRCTGYRPILDSMKSFSTDLIKDIEDLKLCPKVGKVCEAKCRIPTTAGMMTSDCRVWFHPTDLAGVYQIFQNNSDKQCMLVAGGTSHGVYRRDPNVQVFIDVTNIVELRRYEIGTTVQLGGNMTLTELMSVLKTASTSPGFDYLRETLKHLDLVASVQIRNLGTIAGNLMIKHDHPEFLSDIFVMLLTIGARVIIGSSATSLNNISLTEFLNVDMRNRVIVKIILPQWDKESILYGAYKILPRAQHAHPVVNAGFLFTISNSRVTSARICYNGINPQFNMSTATVDFLNGRNLFDPNTFDQATAILDSELQPNWILPAPSPEYRKKLALGLFYKFVVKNAPPNVINAKYQSGGLLLQRPLSSGTQVFDTREDRWPVNKPLPKLEALRQTSGESLYSNDLPYMKNEVWAAFVPATRVLSTIVSIDPTEALAIPGVVAFYSAKDIPGQNTFVANGLFGIVENEELFCADVVKYHSQPAGIILAKSNELAQMAATKVVIMYGHQQSQQMIESTLRDAMSKVELNEVEPTEDSGQNVVNIAGRFEMDHQFHFSLETHTSVCIPEDGRLTLYASTQYMDLVQASVTEVLKLPENQVDIIVRRLGGSFGCKISRSNHVAVGCALASWLSNRPVRFVQSIENNMRISGKRYACISDYTVRVDERGKIGSLTNNFSEDMGCSMNEPVIDAFTIPALPNCYERTASWIFNGTAVLTNAPSHSYFRAPGNLEGISMTENIMEHIAWTLKRDPVDVRLANIPPNTDMATLMPDFIQSTDYRNRKNSIDQYNVQNRWRKRGIAISIMRFPIIYIGTISAAVVIYHFDGSVVISHGGVEMGQGLNTKAAQVAAYTLGIPVEMVTVKSSETFSGANSILTGASIGSETVCHAVQKCCTELLDRMKPVRDRTKNPPWLDVVKECHRLQIDLFSRQTNKIGDLQEYNVWGLACTEMEVDILTGKSQITRVDILEDTGESLNPMIDVGQVEGAFVQGLGYWLLEKMMYDRKTGELKTFNTWEYKVPGAKDIPIDFRVTLHQKKPNSAGFLRSKTTGEMAICLSFSALCALRHALNSARKDAGIEEWYHLGAPTTIEDVLLAAGHNKSDFKLNS